jgi:hypothetical protein
MKSLPFAAVAFGPAPAVASGNVHTARTPNPNEHAFIILVTLSFDEMPQPPRPAFGENAASVFVAAKR